jgi:predicted metal-dependent HD superfamily phosphohydrolase
LIEFDHFNRFAENAEAIEIAINFHDVVYDTHAGDNEDRSARMLEDILPRAGVAADVVARIGGHVRATKAHVPCSADGQLVIDIDLSILGEQPEVFARFEEEIRREYAWVDEAAYLAGRAAVLRGFADRAFIYGTPLFRARYEARAKANVAASLQRLRGGSSDS